MNGSLISPSNGGQQGQVPRTEQKEDLLFVKLPMPEEQLSARVKRAAPIIASNKGLPNPDPLAQTVHVANKLLKRLASKKQSRDNVSLVQVPETQPSGQLYAHIRHQLSRKGDVKLPPNPQQTDSSTNEKVEVVRFPLISRNIPSTLEKHSNFL